MGRRDYRWREPKKSKKENKKAKSISEILPRVEVEVVRKRKKKPSAEE
jgi:hypothetical protein